MSRPSWIRGAVALTVLGGLVAALTVSPVGAAITKKKVKTTATKVVNQLAPGIASSTVSQLAPGIATQVAGPLAGRFAFARDDSSALEDVDGTILSTTITAPTNGHLAITAGSDSNGPPAQFTCFLVVDGTPLGSSDRTVEIAASNEEDNCQTEGAVAVTAGTHTIQFNAIEVDTGVNFDEAVLWVIFVPFDLTDHLRGAIQGQSWGEPCGDGDGHQVQQVRDARGHPGLMSAYPSGQQEPREPESSGPQDHDRGYRCGSAVRPCRQSCQPSGHGQGDPGPADPIHISFAGPGSLQPLLQLPTSTWGRQTSADSGEKGPAFSRTPGSASGAGTNQHQSVGTGAESGEQEPPRQHVRPGEPPRHAAARLRPTISRIHRNPSPSRSRPANNRPAPAGVR